MSYPGWQWDGTQWQRAPQQKQRRTGLIITLGIVIPVVVIALCIGGAIVVTSGGEDDPQADGDQVAEREQEPDEDLSTQGRDGQFEFTVQDLERGAAPADQFSDNAQGEWVLVTLDVENIGDESRQFNSDYQTLYDAEGREYDPASGIREWDYQMVNPGNTTEARLYFDVPEDAELDRLQLHDALLSNGVEVGLPE